MHSGKQHGLYAQGHNSDVLKNIPLKKFISDIPAFTSILPTLQAQGFFTDYQAIDYDMDAFLKEYQIDIERLDQSASMLIDRPLQLERDKRRLIPKQFTSLEEKIAKYVSLTLDVFNNELAQRNYEAGIPDQENVSERVHGLQAGKLGTILGMSDPQILGLTFHDISRPTVEDQTHGHANHCEEGSVISAPLGFETDYCLYHAFAKYLLNIFSTEYNKKLISPVSQISLALQVPSFQKLLQNFPKMSDRELAVFIYLIMFMRLIDDCSKVPAKLLGLNVEYFSNEVIEDKLYKQISSHLARLTKSSEDVDQAVENYKQNLDNAIQLMQRAKRYSNQPELYCTSTNDLHLI